LFFYLVQDAIESSIAVHAKPQTNQSVFVLPATHAIKNAIKHISFDTRVKKSLYICVDN
jgi:hypothetical protein